MKKILVLSIVCMLQMGVASAITNNRVEMQPSSIDNPTKHGTDTDRGCVWMPLVYLEDNLLSFEPSESPIIIYVYRGDRMLFTQMVAEGGANAELPSDLKGKLTLYMVYNDTVYYGDINL